MRATQGEFPTTLEAEPESAEPGGIAPGPGRPGGGLIDRRLLASRGTAVRPFLAAAVAVGVASTIAVVVQAVLLAGIIQSAFFEHADVARLLPRLFALAGAFAARAACAWLSEVVAQRTAVTIAGQLRRRLLHQALDLGPAWLSGERAGELTVTATRGITAVEVYFGRYVPQAVVAGLAPIGILCWVAVTDWISALLLAGLVCLVPVLMIHYGRQAQERTARQWRRLSSLSARYLELVEGLPTLRAFGRESQGRREVAGATESLRVSTMGTLRVAFLSALAMDLLSGLGVGLVAMVLGLRLLHGSLGLSTALAVLLVSPEVFLPLRRAGAEFHASTEGQAAAQRVLDVLDQPVPAAVAHAPGSDTASPGPMGLSLREVSVAYAGGRTALCEFDLSLPAGQHLALLGPSGAGKSTVFGVLLGLVAPTSGAVELTGSGSLALRPGDRVTDDWREHFTWVPQRPHLFGGTLADNLRLGDPGATEQQLADAVGACGLERFIAQLPAGLSTRVGHGGISLSAGERQRLALARALLRPAPIVLLDEPVTHLDRATEEQLEASLAPWLESRTVIVAAHRPQLLGRFDFTLTLSPPVHDAAADGPIAVTSALAGAAQTGVRP